MKTLLAIAALLLGGTAHAGCTNPSLPEGAITYLATSNALAFCDGTNWRLTGVDDASAGSGGCSNPTGAEGKVIFESTHNQMQFCNGENWMAMGPEKPSAADTGCTSGGVQGQLKYSSTANWLQYCNGEDWVNAGAVFNAGIALCSSPGDVCSDGTVFAGLSPDGSEAMYVTPCDAGQTWSGSSCTGLRDTYSWNNGTSNWTSTGQTSSITGRSNTLALAALSDAGSPYKAAEYCDGLTAHGHSDWYLPARAELDLMYTNHSAIGNFDTSGNWYWSASENKTTHAWIQRFSDGTQNVDVKLVGRLVRCARR